MSTESSATASPPRVIVVGGGLAGMAAAVVLESCGMSVTLLEARRHLGGRAGSFEDPETGELVDNSQHVLLGCCTNLRDFYRRMGASDLIAYENAIHFRDAAGKRHDLASVPLLPAPLHLGPSLAMFGILSLAEKVAVSRAMLAMMRLGRNGREALADVPFGQWLDEHRQPAALLEKFYDPILIGSLNEASRRASAEYAIQVFQDAILAHRSAHLLGLPQCSLSELYQRMPCRDVRLGTRVEQLAMEADTVAGVRLTTGEVVSADAVVLAVGRQTVQKWIGREVAQRDARFANLDKLESVPILGVRMWFDRAVVAESHAALITGPLQWLFRKDRAGRVIQGVISAARDWVGRAKEECLRLFEQQIRSLFPVAREAKLERGLIVLEKRATFSPLPGVDQFRPAQAPPAGGVRNLFLAGDYTQTHWPATMEGAVRSGYLAAEGVVASFMPSGGLGRRFVVEDLPLEWPARLLAARPQ